MQKQRKFAFIIPSAEFPQFQLYPNPAQSELIIESTNPLAIEMLNALGETVMGKAILGAEKIDIRALPSGIYWVKDAKNNLGRAFIKE